MKVNSTFKLEKINHRYFAFDGGTGNIFEISEILYEILLNRNEKLPETAIMMNWKNLKNR